MSTVYSLHKQNDSLAVDLQGGRIRELILNKNPLLGTFRRIDGKEANTHVCIPNFGDEGVGKYGLPSHGPLRDSLWQLVSQTDSSLTIQCDMSLTGSYPTTLSTIQTFSLIDHSFIHEITIVNTGGKKAPVNAAIHYYWHTPRGWEQLLLNGENVYDYIRNDAFIDANTKTTIQIEGKPSIQMEIDSSFAKINLWAARIEREGKTLYDHNYACIEPVQGTGTYFGSSESMLNPDETKTIWVRLIM